MFFLLCIFVRFSLTKPSLCVLFSSHPRAKDIRGALGPQVCCHLHMGSSGTLTNVCHKVELFVTVFSASVSLLQPLALPQSPTCIFVSTFEPWIVCAHVAPPPPPSQQQHVLGHRRSDRACERAPYSAAKGKAL